MIPVLTAALVFLCAYGSALLARFVAAMLPNHHRGAVDPRPAADRLRREAMATSVGRHLVEIGGLTETSSAPLREALDQRGQQQLGIQR